MISVNYIMIANVLQGDAFLVEEINCPLHILEGMDPHFPTCVWYFLNLTIRRRVLTKLKLRTGPLPKTTSNKDYRRFLTLTMRVSSGALF